MNKLSKSITCKFFSDSASYEALCNRWAEVFNSDEKHQLRASHFLLYAVLRGKDWRKAFSTPSNPNKLNNLNDFALGQALYEVSSTYYEPSLLAPFGGLVTKEMMAEVRKLLRPVFALSITEIVGPDGQYRIDAYPTVESEVAHD